MYGTILSGKFFWTKTTPSFALTLPAIAMVDLTDSKDPGQDFVLSGQHTTSQPLYKYPNEAQLPAALAAYFAFLNTSTVSVLASAAAPLLATTEYVCRDTTTLKKQHK